MKNKSARIISTLLCLVLGIACMFGTACAGGGDNEKIKKLYVATYDGGFGYQYLKDAEARLEAAYEGYVFADGKIGLDVVVTPSKQVQTSNMMNTYSGWTDDIMFCNESYNYIGMVEQGMLLDITDICTATLPGESVSIDGKIYEQYKNWFVVDGKYYGLPWSQGTYGLNYDITLFEDHNLFFKANGDFVESIDDERGYGPNGKTGIDENGFDWSDDDGLPVTYDDFFKLCDKMVSEGITPIVWSGKLQNYVNGFLQTLYADYEGSAAYKKYGMDGINNYLNTKVEFTGLTDYIENVNYGGANEGTYDSKFDNGVPEIKETEITSPYDAYLTFRQPGMYYAVSFLERIIKNEAYYDHTDCFGTALDHIGAQEKYYFSSQIDPPIGILLEGNWWYNEAVNARADFVDTYGEDEAHEYGVMYLPKASADLVSPYTQFDSAAGGLGFISSKVASDPEKLALAKEYFQSLFTNSALVAKNKSSGTPAPYNYTATDAELATFSNIALQAYNMHRASNYFVALRQDDLFLQNTAIVMTGEFFRTKDYGATPSSEFVKGSCTAKQFFDSIGNFWKSTTWHEYVR